MVRLLRSQHWRLLCALLMLLLLLLGLLLDLQTLRVNPHDSFSMRDIVMPSAQLWCMSVSSDCAAHAELKVLTVPKRVSCRYCALGSYLRSLRQLFMLSLLLPAVCGATGAACDAVLLLRRRGRRLLLRMLLLQVAGSLAVLPRLCLLAHILLVDDHLALRILRRARDASTHHASAAPLLLLLLLLLLLFLERLPLRLQTSLW